MNCYNWEKLRRNFPAFKTQLGYDIPPILLYICTCILKPVKVNFTKNLECVDSCNFKLILKK